MTAPVRHHFILKFISGKYEGVEFPLPDGKEIYIGRSSDQDMVLVENMVSRRHGKIVARGAEVWLEDLGSTNGTFVNGERITSVKVKDADRILLGTSILKLLKQDGVSADAAPAMRPSAAPSSSTMSGRLDEIPIPDLLQLFSTSKKTGILLLEDKEHGKIYLRDGRVFFATIVELPQLPPQKSFNRIVFWKSGFFGLQNLGAEKFDAELTEGTESMLMEAMRLHDEFERAKPGLPLPQDKIGLKVPMTAPMTALNAPLLETLQLVMNQATVQGALDHGRAADSEILINLQALIEKGYVEKK